MDICNYLYKAFFSGRLLLEVHTFITRFTSNDGVTPTHDTNDLSIPVTGIPVIMLQVPGQMHSQMAFFKKKIIQNGNYLDLNQVWNYLPSMQRI